MRHRGCRAVLVLCLVSGAPLAAGAQTAESPPYDPHVDVQLFEYPVGPKTFFAVDDANLAAAKQMSFNLMVTFLTNPVSVYNVSDDGMTIENHRTDVVESMFAGQLGGAYGVSDTLQLGLALPVVFSESGQGIDRNTATPGEEPLQISGTGDLRAEVKARLYDGGAIRIAGGGALTLPSSFGTDGSDYLGDNLPTLRGRVAFQWTAPDGKLSAGANAGFILRKPRTIYASTIGQQITFGLATSYAFTDRFMLVGEMFGRTGLPDFASVDSSPIEAGGGLRVRATKAIAVTVGADAGIVRGIGSPGLRVFGSVGYEPDTRDSDGDGIANNRDRCPLIVEDRDGHDDSDGCPDDDNDGDHRADGEDTCPDKAEDIDGFDDDDGCPDLDNDGDGVADLEDRYCPLDKEDGQAPQPSDGCPAGDRDTDNDGIKDPLDSCFDQEEDVDAFDDGDGCPELDNDADGVADDTDQCPVCTEDKDGVQDEDGCPEFDVDVDGIRDEKDQCPAEAEVVNGVDDFDGCPDEGGAVIAEFDGDRMTFKAPVAFDKKGLTKTGTLLLDQASIVMLQHPEITRWMVVVTAKKDADVQKRGDWVVKHLVNRGVPEDRIHLLAQKGSDKVAIGVEERAEEGEAPAMVCPAGMQAVSKGGSAKAEPAPDVEPDVETEVELE